MKTKIILTKWDNFTSFCNWRREKLFAPELTEIQIENCFEKFYDILV